MNKLIFFFFISFTSLSQIEDVSITMYDWNQQVNKIPEVMKFGKNIDGDYFIWKREYNIHLDYQNFIELRDENMKVIKSINIDGLSIFKNRTLLGKVVMNNSLIFFSKKATEKENIYTVSFQSINLSTLEESKVTDLFTGSLLKPYGEGYVAYTLPYARVAASIEIHASPDGKSILIAARQEYKRKENEIISFYVLDENMNISWAKENFEISHEDRYYKTLSFTINNKGDAFMLGGLNNQEKPDLDLYRFSKDEEVIQKKIKYFKKPLAYQLQLTVNQKGVLVLGGCLPSEISPNKTIGTFCHLFNSNTLDIINETSNKFETEVYLYGLNPKFKNVLIEKKTGELYGYSNLQIDSIVFIKDEIYIISRRTVLESTNFTGPGYTDYSIFISKYSKDGEFIFNTKIPYKMTKGASPLQKSYAFMVTKKGLMFVFPDDLENLDKDFTKEALHVYLHDCFSTCTIGVNGEQKRELLYSFEENFRKRRQILDLEVCSVTNGNNDELLMLVHLGKTVKIKYFLVKEK